MERGGKCGGVRGDICAGGGVEEEVYAVWDVLSENLQFYGQHGQCLATPSDS
jgi:hypothetical protein